MNGKERFFVSDLEKYDDGQTQCKRTERHCKPGVAANIQSLVSQL